MTPGMVLLAAFRFERPRCRCSSGVATRRLLWLLLLLLLPPPPRPLLLLRRRRLLLLQLLLLFPVPLSLPFLPRRAVQRRCRRRPASWAISTSVAR